VAFSSAKGLDIEWCKVKDSWRLSRRSSTLAQFRICTISYVLSLLVKQLIFNFAGPWNWIVGSRSGSIPWHITRCKQHLICGQ
jgi:hypothetical protein